MQGDLVSKAEIDITVPVSKVWDAIINPQIICKYMFGTEVVSEWKKEAPITWKGIWDGQPYEDKGVVVDVQPEKVLEFTHFIPDSAKADILEHNHTMKYELTSDEHCTHVVLFQDNNPDIESKEHSQKMWSSMLVEMKRVLEGV